MLTFVALRALSNVCRVLQACLRTAMQFFRLLGQSKASFVFNHISSFNSSTHIRENFFRTHTLPAAQSLYPASDGARIQAQPQFVSEGSPPSRKLPILFYFKHQNFIYTPKIKPKIFNRAHCGNALGRGWIVDFII